MGNNKNVNMKKLVKLASVAMVVLMATSCCNCNKNSEFDNEDQACEVTWKKHHKHHKCHKGDFKKCPDMEKWAKFDELSEAEQKALIAKCKAKVDSVDAARKAAFEKFKADWENFDNLSIQEQKALLDFKCHFGGSRGFNKHGHKGFHKGCHKGNPKCPKAAQTPEK